MSPRPYPGSVDPGAMRFAYADPPYLGCCGLYGHFHGEDGRCWDKIPTHARLIRRLVSEFPDGWALSASSPSLLKLARYLPDNARLMAWVKPFASFKPNVNPAYAWEPVVFHGGRKIGRDVPTVRDYVAAGITLKRGFTGAKPEAFCHWLFEVLGMRPDDEFHDLFPGSGAVTRAWEAWRRQCAAI